MSVNILYCEGGSKSTDIRVFRSFLPGSCLVKQAGSKYGFDRRILFLKREGGRPATEIAGIRDRDFDNDTSAPLRRPKTWIIREDDNDFEIGWIWERKEIENYLLDPNVVLHALGNNAPPIEDYEQALHETAKDISIYTAARIALSLSRVRILPLNNQWGEKLGKGHLFPEILTEASCRIAVSEIVSDYQQTYHIEEINVLAKFDEILPTCSEGGSRFSDFLTFFAGKDLLVSMEPKLKQFGFHSYHTFREKIIVQIEKSTEDVWAWLPEWQELYHAVI